MDEIKYYFISYYEFTTAQENQVYNDIRALMVTTLFRLHGDNGLLYVMMPEAMVALPLTAGGNPISSGSMSGSDQAPHCIFRKKGLPSFQARRKWGSRVEGSDGVEGP